MRKVRFYTAYGTMKTTLKKSAVDGYLDDSCEIAYYCMKGSSYWYAILLSCGIAICIKKKKYECIEESYARLEKAKKLEKEMEINKYFDEAELASDEGIESRNHWTDANTFIDLTTKEGSKILQSIKAKKRKNKPL